MIRYQRYDHVYIIGTVGVKKRTFKLAVRPPKNLAQNQFAYELKIAIDPEKWRERVKEVLLPEIEPPSPPQAENIAVIVEKDTTTKVLDTLAGR